MAENNPLSIIIDNDLNIVVNNPWVEKLVAEIRQTGNGQATVWPSQEVKMPMGTDNKVSLDNLKRNISPVPPGSYRAIIKAIYAMDAGGETEEKVIAFKLTKEQIDWLSAPAIKPPKPTMQHPPEPTSEASGQEEAQQMLKEVEERASARLEEERRREAAAKPPTPLPAAKVQPKKETVRIYLPSAPAEPAPGAPVEEKPAPSKVAPAQPQEDLRIGLQAERIKKQEAEKAQLAKQLEEEKRAAQTIVEEEKKKTAEAQRLAAELTLRLTAAQASVTAAQAAAPPSEMVNFQKKLDALAAKTASLSQLPPNPPPPIEEKSSDKKTDKLREIAKKGLPWWFIVGLVALLSLIGGTIFKKMVWEKRVTDTLPHSGGALQSLQEENKALKELLASKSVSPAAIPTPTNVADVGGASPTPTSPVGSGGQSVVVSGSGNAFHAPLILNGAHIPLVPVSWLCVSTTNSFSVPSGLNLRTGTVVYSWEEELLPGQIMDRLIDGPEWELSYEVRGFKYPVIDTAICLNSKWVETSQWSSSDRSGIPTTGQRFRIIPGMQSVTITFTVRKIRR